MDFGYWTLIGIGAGVVVACFARILVRVASRRNAGAGPTYQNYKLKGILNE